MLKNSVTRQPKQSNFTIYDMPPSERPRERLKVFGEESLSSLELLNVLLGKGSAGESVIILSQRLLQQFGSIDNIATASLEELCNTKGLGFAKACQIKAAFELGKRNGQTSPINKKYIINAPEEVVRIISQRIRNKNKEHIFLLLLDIRKKLIKESLVSIGTLDASLIHPRDVFKEIISSFAAGFILVHNHPSGNPNPSSDDINLTRQLISASKFMDIAFLDHVIIGSPGYYSFKEKQGKLFL